MLQDREKTFQIRADMVWKAEDGRITINMLWTVAKSDPPLANYEVTIFNTVNIGILMG